MHQIRRHSCCKKSKSLVFFSETELTKGDSNLITKAGMSMSPTRSTAQVQEKKRYKNPLTLASSTMGGRPRTRKAKNFSIWYQEGPKDAQFIRRCHRGKGRRGARAELNEKSQNKEEGVTGWGLLLAEDEAHGGGRAGERGGRRLVISSDPTKNRIPPLVPLLRLGVGIGKSRLVGALPFGD